MKISYLFYTFVTLLGVYVIVSARTGATHDFIFLPLLLLSMIFLVLHMINKKKKRNDL